MRYKRGELPDEVAQGPVHGLDLQAVVKNVRGELDEGLKEGIGGCPNLDLEALHSLDHNLEGLIRRGENALDYDQGTYLLNRKRRFRLDGSCISETAKAALC